MKSEAAQWCPNHHRYAYQNSIDKTLWFHGESICDFLSSACISDDESDANAPDIDWELDEGDFEEDWVDEADEDGTLLEKVFPPIEK